MIATESIPKTDIRTLDISSAAFAGNTYIPSKYTCDGENTNPPLNIGNIPKETRSLALIVDDPDGPIRIWTHWIVWNIPPTKKIKEGNTIGLEGLNDFGQYNYGGPCPPSGIHHYHFKVYALDNVLDLKKSSAKHDLEKAISSHIIAFGELIGLYKKAL